MEDIRRFLGDMDLDAVDRVCGLFREVDATADRFRRFTHIRCPQGCGACCAGSLVETTAVEMLPLAVELWRRNEAELWLERVDRN
ncbi:MAG: hypothetical protein P8Z37_17335 [Acidobacteriota bacterium]